MPIVYHPRLASSYRSPPNVPGLNTITTGRTNKQCTVETVKTDNESYCTGRKHKPIRPSNAAASPSNAIHAPYTYAPMHHAMLYVRGPVSIIYVNRDPYAK